MSFHFYRYKLFQILILWIGCVLNTNADVIVNVSAIMLAPACSISSSDGHNPIEINYDIVNIEKLNNSPPRKSFSLFISECDLTKSLAIVISPKANGSMMAKGRNILATSVEGLGISFSDITMDKNTAIDVGRKQQIYPEILNNKGKVEIQSELVNIKPISELPKGLFSASMSVLITYN
ncbi:TPA: fimbrial protein [Proteus mirabilis]